MTPGYKLFDRTYKFALKKFFENAISIGFWQISDINGRIQGWLFFNIRIAR